MALTNICHGCLSTERKLIAIDGHVKLYQQLLLKRSHHKTMKPLMCWECHKILNNIHMFRLKITQAQKLLYNTSLQQQYSLSNLTSTKIDDYHLIMYDEEKINPTPTVALEVKTEKQECIENNLDDKLEGIKVDLELNGICNIKEEIKDESNYFDDNIDDENDVKDSIGDENDAKEPDEPLVPIEILERKVEIKVQQGRKKRGVLKQKYRTILMDLIPDKRSLYEIVSIDQNAAKKELEKKKKETSRKRFQCSLCYCGFAQQEFYDRHMAVLHNQKNEFECDVCGCRYRDLKRIRVHVPSHFARFKCKLCAQEFNVRSKVYMHFKHGPHARQIECKKCSLRFDCRKRREFYDHYRNTHEFVECDYCGKRRTTKSGLAQHIKSRHADFRCKPCDLRFSSRHALKNHNERKHTTDASERNYCVECDAQFANTLLYEEHVYRSTRHNPKPKVKCLECDRTYSKHCYMINHYNLVHLKVSKYVCPHCEKKFLTGSRLRYHINFTHEKLPKPRNNICTYCGRGFNTRRILENHMRTHTGERPFACARCPAAFAQKQALKTHAKSAHK